MFIGYARVSLDDQQNDVLTAASCERIYLSSV
jgi:hypothetical protein